MSYISVSYRLSSSYHPHTVAHLCIQFNHVFAVLISMPSFKSNKLDQARPKIAKKLQNLRMLGALPPDPQWLLAPWSSAPLPKSLILPLQISSFAPG